MVWIAYPQPPFDGGEAMLIDLASATKRDLGPDRLAAVIDDGHVGITRAGGNASESVDLSAGVRTAISGIPFYNTNFDIVTTPYGYQLRREIKDAARYSYTFYLTDEKSGRLLLRFDAIEAVPAGRGALAVATEPVYAGPPDERGYRPATTNVFLIDVARGRAEFIAAADYLFQFPLSANDRYIIWTEDYCAATPGHTRLYDRQTKQIIEIDATLWPQFTPNGLLLDGPFGGDALIDPDTLEYRTALSAGGGSWSPDYRYASLGQVGGHGGLCP